MSEEEIIESTKIYSVAGELNSKKPIITIDLFVPLTIPVHSLQL